MRIAPVISKKMENTQSFAPRSVIANERKQMKLTYLHELIEQLEKQEGVTDTGGVQITANEGEAIVVVVRERNKIRMFVQDESLSNLEPVSDWVQVS